MVNVAGRSKGVFFFPDALQVVWFLSIQNSTNDLEYQGCHNCKRRRVRCDERKSGGCQRCERAGLTCDGYKKLSWQFVDEKARIEHRIEKRTLSSSKNVLPVVEPENEDSLEVVQQIQEKRYTSSLPHTLDLKGFQNSIEITFTLSQLTKIFPWFSFCK